MMGGANRIELGLTIPLQRHLHIKILPCSQEPDRRFCWDLHVIILRGQPSLLAVPCHSRYTFVCYDLKRLEWERLPDIFLEGLNRSLSVASFPSEAADLLCGTDQPLFTKTHGRREVAFLNRAWDDVMAAELALDESAQSQPLLDQIVNAKPSRCVGFDGLGAVFAHEKHISIEIYFQHFKPPFNQENRQMELIQQFNEIPEINIPPAKIFKRPSFDCSLLVKESSFKQYIQIYEDMLAEIRRFEAQNI